MKRIDEKQVWTKGEPATFKAGHIEELTCKGYTLKLLGVLHEGLDISHVAEEAAITTNFLKECLNNPDVFRVYAELIEAKSRIQFLEDQQVEQAKNFTSYKWYQMFAACLASAAVTAYFILINTI